MQACLNKKCTQKGALRLKKLKIKIRLYAFLFILKFNISGLAPVRCNSATAAEQIGFTLAYVLTSIALCICSVAGQAVRTLQGLYFCWIPEQDRNSAKFNTEQTGSHTPTT